MVGSKTSSSLKKKPVVNPKATVKWNFLTHKLHACVKRKWTGECSMDEHVLWHLPPHRQSSRWEQLKLGKIKQILRDKVRLDRARRQQRGVMQELLDEVVKDEEEGANQVWNEEEEIRHPEEGAEEEWLRLVHKDLAWEVLRVV